MIDENSQPNSSQDPAEESPVDDVKKKSPTDKLKSFLTLGDDKKQRRKILLISALVLIIFGLGTGIAWGAAVWAMVYFRGEPNGSGSGIINCAGSTLPLTVNEFSSDGLTYKIPTNSKNGKQGVGGISHEDHLASIGDDLVESEDKGNMSGNRNTYKMPDHLDATNFSTNCPSGDDLCNTSSQYWVDSGQGTGGWGKIPSNYEAWYMNTRWNTDGSDDDPSPKSKSPPGGTRIIIYSPKTNRAIVTIAGYEWGPAKRTGNILGASTEVLANLGVDHNDEVTFGFASDQSLAPGNVFGNCTAGSAIGGTIFGNTIVIDPGHNSGYNKYSKTINGSNNEGDDNWIIANKVKTKIENKGFQTILTKNSAAENPSLPQRAEFANSKNAALFVSLHSNDSGGPGPWGAIYCVGVGKEASDGDVNWKTESCASTASATRGKSASHSIVENILSQMKLKNPTYKGGDLGVLNGLKMPGTLIEMYAHDKDEDIEKIDGKADQLAQAIADGILAVMKKN